MDTFSGETLKKHIILEYFINNIRYDIIQKN